MDQRQLEYFVAVAEELNFTRAARRVYAVQSTVSAGIRALERELGTALFHRSTKSVQLTDSGRALLPEARLAIEALDRTRATVDETAAGLRGQVRVGTLSGMKIVDVASLAGDFRNRYPGVRLQVEISPTESTGHIDKIRRDLLDVAFVVAPPTDLCSLWSRTLAEIPFGVLVADSHPFAHRESLTLTDLTGEAFVEMLPGSGSRVLLDRIFRQAGIVRQLAVEVADACAVAEYVAAGLGIAVLPALGTSAALPVRTVPLVEPSLMWQLHVISRPHDTAARPTKAFLDLIPEHTRHHL